MSNENKAKASTLSSLIIFIIIAIAVIGIAYFANKFIFFAPYTTIRIIKLILLCCVIISIIFIMNSFGNKLCVTLGSVFLTCFSIASIAFFATGLKVFMYEDLRGLAGEIQTQDFSEDMEVISLSDLPIITTDLAKNLADKKLGELTSLGSQMTVGELNMQRVGDKLYYVAPLEFTGYFKWKNNDGISPGYVMVNAQEENDVKLITELDGKKLSIKYLQNAYFSNNLERYAFSVANDTELTDFTFELDDEGNPYWVITTYEEISALNGKKVTGTLIIDAQTGEAKRYSIEKTPEWVDRIQPLDIIDEHLNDWGSLVHGVFNFSKKDEVTTTEGYKLVYNDGNCYYYTGITSVGSDESLIGFFLTNTRTGETNMYKVSGAIEKSAQASAEGVSEYASAEYKASFPLLINLQNEPTYFMTLHDAKGLIKAYAFVNVKNYNMVGSGDNLSKAYNSYLSILSNNNKIDLNNASEINEVTGIIDRIGVSMGTENFIYCFKLKDNENTFKVSDTFVDAVLTKEGDEVTIKFINNTGQYITVQEFKNNTLK